MVDFLRLAESIIQLVCYGRNKRSAVQIFTTQKLIKAVIIVTIKYGLQFFFEVTEIDG
jgi:hypothetical protein